MLTHRPVGCRGNFAKLPKGTLDSSFGGVFGELGEVAAATGRAMSEPPHLLAVVVARQTRLDRIAARSAAPRQNSVGHMLFCRARLGANGASRNYVKRA